MRPAAPFLSPKVARPSSSWARWGGPGRRHAFSPYYQSRPGIGCTTPLHKTATVCLASRSSAPCHVPGIATGSLTNAENHHRRRLGSGRVDCRLTTITIETRIAAPIELCFDLARDVETHLRTSAGNQERVVGGKTSGVLDLGDSVTWEAVHFRVRQRLTSRIVECDRPRRFVDEMVNGVFASLRHVHEFSVQGGISDRLPPR